MTQKSCTIWILLVGLMWIFPVSPVDDSDSKLKLKTCFTQNKSLIVADKFYGVITKNFSSNGNFCVVFLKNNTSINQTLDDQWPQLDMNNSLYISKHLIKLNFSMYVLWGNCSKINYTDFNCSYNYSVTGPCQVRCINTGTICKQATYNQHNCLVDNMYTINIEDTQCISCDNPVKAPQGKIEVNVSVEIQQGGKIDAASAVKIINAVSNLASSINGSSAALSVGNGITGVLVAHKNPIDIEEVSFAYGSPNSNISIISSDGNLNGYSRSVSVSKEAFDKAVSMNVTVPFAALLRFNDMAGDALNSTLLGNEVLAVEMGTNITELTDPINITFRNVIYDMIPNCHSWNGEGSQPNWTKDGCDTIINGSTITCQCSHLTFFAILMTAPNQTISSSDLNNLTVITQVGCGLSMFFLSIVLFMHYLMRKIRANKSTRLLIHLVLAMFLLNFTFLINSFVANLKNTVGCQIMAAVMHYFMLATFTWFAAHGFHLCLQLYTGGKIVIHHYILKVSITSWVIPSLVGIVLLIIGKYGEEDVLTDNPADHVAMCWITDINTHYIVNIGYYSLVFLINFTTFIITMSWLVCLKRYKAGTIQVNRNGKSIVTIMGLCCMLGITWGFAFFAYGALRIPAYYIFTILNSFQGFFLFIYYYNIRHTAPTNTDMSDNRNSTSSTTTTLQTSLDILENPYINLEAKT